VRALVHERRRAVDSLTFLANRLDRPSEASELNPLDWIERPWHAKCFRKALCRTPTVLHQEVTMPEARTLKAARQARREGKAPSTQAGEFVREEIEHIREGKHGARSAKQAIAIGLAKARRAGVDLEPPARGRTSEATRKRAIRDYEVGHGAATAKPSPTRSRAAKRKLQEEGSSAASHLALSRQAKKAARTRKRAATKKR
jgi:hypothetical protein